MQTKLTIEGMHCGGCVKSVSAALSSVPSITNVDVNLEAGLATVSHDGAAAGAMIAAVEDAGFDAALAENA